MHCLQVIYHLDNINPHILKTKGYLVRVGLTGNKAIYLKIPTSYKRFQTDASDIAKFSIKQFGQHGKREEGILVTAPQR